MTSCICLVDFSKAFIYVRRTVCMEEVCPPRTAVDLYQKTRRHIPENGTHIHCCEETILENHVKFDVLADGNMAYQRPCAYLSTKPRNSTYYEY